MDNNQIDEPMWVPPPRNVKTGHRVSIGPYKPVSTRFLNWRWWLAEYPMRMLARYAAKAESVKEMQGEEYVGTLHNHSELTLDPSWERKDYSLDIAYGTAIHEQIERHYRDMTPDGPVPLPGHQRNADRRE